MATQIYNWTGTVSWAKVYDPDEYNGASRWVINFYPDDLEAVMKSGTQAQPREDQNGDTFIRLRRDTQKVIGNDLVRFSPPRLIGQVEVSYRDVLTGETIYSWSVLEKPKLELEQVGERVSIGNGSKVSVRAAVYDTQRGKGTRLEGLNILKLVEYNPEVSDEAKAADMNGEATAEKVKKAQTKAKRADKEESKDAAPWD